MPVTKIKGVLLKGIAHFSACMSPVIPLLLAGGLTKLLVLILTMTGLLSDAGTTSALLGVISDAPFYFLPVFVAYSSARHFDTEPLYAMAAVSAMLLPDFIEMMSSAEAITFVGLPVVKASYSSTVIPSIVLVYFMSLIVNFLKKSLPKALNIFLPMLAVLITALLGILLIGPACVALSGLLSDGVNRLYGMNPAIACAALGFLVPLMVTTGVHMVFITAAIMQISAEGLDPFFMACCLSLNMALGASMLAVSLKTKNSDMKKTATAAGAAALGAGVSEPSLFGVCVPKKTPMAACMLACGLAGAYQGFVSVNCYVFAFPCVFSILMFSNSADPGNLLKAVITGLIALVSAFLLTLAMYRDE